MADLLSLKNKFEHLLMGEQTIHEETVLKEAVIGAVAKLPYVVGGDDKAFLDQFDPIYWKSAIKARFDLLFNELVKLDKIRQPAFAAKFRQYYQDEKKKFQKDHHSKLDKTTIEHIAERHAYARAKADIANDPKMQKLIPQQDLGMHEFVVSTGPRQTKTIKAFPYIYGPNGLLKKLEGTPGRMDGHDMFNAREAEIPLVNKVTGEPVIDEETGEPVVSKTKITDGFVFPKMSQIQEQLDNHFKYMADGLIEPANPEEAKAYDPANRSNFKPVRTSRGYLRDTMSKDYYLEDFTKRFKIEEDNNNPTLPAREKQANARRKAIIEFARLVNHKPRSLLFYSNGNPMTGAKVINDSQGRPTTVTLDSDRTQDRDGVPTNAVKLPHKIVKVNGEDTEVPVLLSGMPFKRMENDLERMSHAGMEIGRDYYDPITKTNQKLFRKLTPSEFRNSYQGSKGYIYSGSLDPNRNSPESKFLPSFDPKHESISKSILNHHYRLHGRPVSFVEYIIDCVNSWLVAPCEKDRVDLCFEKMILHRFQKNLYTLAQIKVMSNLNEPGLFQQYIGVQQDVIRKMVSNELDRFLQQDLGRGTRKNRQATIKSKKEEIRCEYRAGAAGQCVFNYDVDKFVQKFISYELQITKLRPKQSVSDLRSEVAEELNAMYAMLDMIQLLYEELNKTTAATRIETFRDRVFRLGRNEFVKACEDEIANVLTHINKRIKDKRKKEILVKFKDLFATHQLGKMADLVGQYRQTSATQMREPFRLRDKEEISADITAAPVAVVDKIKKAADEYEKRMEENPVMNDKDIIKGLTTGFTKDEKKKFEKAISANQVSMKTKIAAANKSITDIKKFYDDRLDETPDKKPNLSCIPFQLTNQFFDSEGNDERLNFASKPKLEELRTVLTNCLEILNKQTRSDRPRILRFRSRLSTVETELSSRT